MKYRNGYLKRRSISASLYLLLLLPVLILTGCKTPAEYRMEADRAATAIIRNTQEEVLDESGEFTIERPSDILRRRLLIEQDLPYYGEPSLGAGYLTPPPHWPDTDSSGSPPPFKSPVSLESGGTLRLSLVQALQVAALNRSAYQSEKEDVFRAALDLDLQRNDFRYILNGDAESVFQWDRTGLSAEGDAVKGTENSGSFQLDRTLRNGTALAAALTLDLVSLLTQGQTSSFGITGDASISIPLLRGSGRHIIMEPLTQAERNVVYAIYDFERYKKTFAVEIARGYLEVLQQLDQVNNALENYRNLEESARRSRMLADAGRLPEIEVDQAVQRELAARSRWISETALYKSRLDSFKRQMGLPPDAKIELERTSLMNPDEQVFSVPPSVQKDHAAALPEESFLSGEGYRDPAATEESAAIESGLEHRLDLRVSEGRVRDAQRRVVVAADALGAELTLFGEAVLGQSRSLSTADLEDARLRPSEGLFRGLIRVDFPFERTAERDDFRNSYIDLDRAVREFQDLEDDIKLSVRERLREMFEARENLQIQKRAVSLAEKRVKSVNLFLEAGRAQIRDLLEAQEALLNARNAVTAALVRYRVAQLELQRDTGLLKIDEKGLFLMGAGHPVDNAGIFDKAQGIG